MKKVLILILLLLLPTNAYAMLSMLQGGSEGADLATSGTEYLPARGGIDPDTTESTKQTLISEAGTVKTFYVELRTAPGAVTTRTFTLRKNGSNQSLTVTISGTDTTGSDLSNSFTVVAGDRLTISSTVTGTPAASVVFWSMLFDSSTAKRSILNGNRSTISTTVGNYVSLGGHTGTSIETSEFANEIRIPLEIIPLTPSPYPPGMQSLSLLHQAGPHLPLTFMSVLPLRRIMMGNLFWR